MCARFTLKSSAVVLQGMFELDEVPELPPRYNIAPSQMVSAVVSEGGKRRLRDFKWGLLPSWAASPSLAQSLINAKCETLAEKPAFRAAFRKRRCLILADGFFEWIDVEPDEEASLFEDALPKPKGRKPIKQPYYFTLRDGSPFAIAGVHEFWKAPDAEPIESCALVTTDPNSLVRDFHDRMPAILEPGDYAAWLDLDAPPAYLLSLLKPYPDGGLVAWPVTRRMNDPRFESPEAVTPIAA